MLPEPTPVSIDKCFPSTRNNFCPYLLAAVATAAYGILALWATSSHRHWFLRKPAPCGRLVLLLILA
jgi:hypothetical protein